MLGPAKRGQVAANAAATGGVFRGAGRYDIRESSEGTVRAHHRASRFSAKASRILVAGRTAEGREELRIALELEGHQIAEAETAEQTLKETCSRRHHLFILSSGFEGKEPYELCRSIRLRSDLAIIVLAGHGDTRQSRIDALNAGADDHLATPFVLRELLARMRAVLRRVMPSTDEGYRIVLQDRVIDLKSYKIKGPACAVPR